MIIVAIALVFLGPDKLPQAARSIGQGWRALKKLQQKIESDVREVMPDLPSGAELARVVRSPVNLLNEIAARTDTLDVGEVEDEPLPTERDTPIHVSPTSSTTTESYTHVGPYAAPPTAADPSWN